MAERKHKFFVHYLPIYGCVSTGLIYTAVGVIAILSFLEIKQGGADEGSLLAFLNSFLIGKILVWIILAGTISFIAWRIFEAFKDPYNYGNNKLGIARRLGIGLSSIADVLIAYSAIMVLSGISDLQESGEPDEEREMVGSMLQEGWGDVAVISMGVIICLTALVQFYYGITRGYRERLDIKNFSSNTKNFIHLLAWVGYLGRGIIIGIIGFFFIKAGVLEDAQQVVNTDKAFNFLGENVGHLAFIIVAIFTIAYGVFMFFMAVTYDTDNKKEAEGK